MQKCAEGNDLAAVEQFADIRAYDDSEVSSKLQSLVRDPALARMFCQFKMPRAHAQMPNLMEVAVRLVLRVRANGIRRRIDLYQLLEHYVEDIVATTTDGFSHSGSEHLPADEPCLFISNHRDILLDAVFLNYALWLKRYPLTQIAVGDNLTELDFVTELMRILGAFIVVRNADTQRALYKAITRTSSYIRHVLEHGQSLWIAQKQGRSKDGLDRTDPAILKMFMLAFRSDCEDLESWLDRVNLVPVSLSYEIDPCARAKANELFTKATQGEYRKSEHEDFQSMLTGLFGYKGRVHVAFSPPIRGAFEEPEQLAEQIDRNILDELVPFKTYLEANHLLGANDGPFLENGKVRQAFEEQMADLPEDQKRYVLCQYANQVQGKDIKGAGV